MAKKTEKKSKKKDKVNVQHTVQLSVNHESLIRDLIKDAEPAKPAASASGPSSIRQYNRVYDELLKLGFQDDHIRQALSSLVGATVTQEAALDWLCLHLPSDQLPRGFRGGNVAAGSSTSGGQVQVVSTAQGKPRPGQESKPAAEVPVVPVVRKQREVEVDPQQQKAWILQYMQDSDSDGSKDGSGGEEEDEEVGWDLWMDPREVERRRAERRAAAVPPEVRRVQVAEEWMRAREAAAAAKASRDKEKQKAAGDIIRQLKQEMQRLGLTEEEAASMVPAPAPKKQQQQQQEQEQEQEQEQLTTSNAEQPEEAAGALAAAEVPGGDAGQLEAQEQGSVGGEGTAGVAGDESPAVFDLWEEAGPPPSSAAGASDSAGREPPQEGSGAAQQGKGGGGAAGDDEDAPWAMDLFEDGGALEEAAPSTVVAAKAAPVPQRLEPWGAGTGGGRPKKGGKGRPAAAPVVEVKQPKALLQQWCQRVQWAPPRFQRLHERATYCYSVTLDPGATRGPKRRGLKGPRSYQLAAVDEDNGWGDISEAQNAAATRALFELLADPANGTSGGAAAAEEAAQIRQQLGLVFGTLWDRWAREAASGGASSSRAEAEAQSEREREEFLRQLLQQQQKQQQQGANGQQRGDAAGSGEEDGDGDDWEAAAGRDEAAARQQQAQSSAKQDAETARASRALQEAQQRWRSSAEGTGWLEKRGKLPVIGIRQGLVKALATSDVVVVGGATGSGKTTQVPQYILEDAIERGVGGACSIVCTQPRRIAAMSVAERVAEERGEPAPGAPGALVGYHVRLEAASTRSTRLLFCTTGILLRRLTGDGELREVSCVVVDEVHERSMHSDFLLALLRDLLPRRKAQGNPLKVVLMSATLDAELYSKYFAPYCGGPCPVLCAEGRTFPVEHRFLEDVYEEVGYHLAPDAPAALRSGGPRGLQQFRKQAGGNKGKQQLLRTGWGDEEADGGPLNPHYDPEQYMRYSDATRRNLARVNEERIDLDLVEALLAHIDATAGPGAILVFLPGMGEITAINDRLAGSRAFRGGRHVVVPLHSTVAPQLQRQAFKRPPEGVRKIVLATNIAETSLTIEDVVYVIDTGRHKERRYDAGRRMSLLVEDWVSRASAMQRRGRAGRVRPGVCYALYTQARMEALRAHQAPEITRVPLEELVLQIHFMHLGSAAAFLERVLQPPLPRAVAAALASLRQVGALKASPEGPSDAGPRAGLQEEEELTALGRHLAQLPVEPRLGKLLVLGACLGCLAPALTIAACLSHKSPFASTATDKSAAEAAAARTALSAKGSGTVAEGQQSDHLLLVAAYAGWQAELRGGGRGAAAQYARRHGLVETTLGQLGEMRSQFVTMLADMRLLQLPEGARRPLGQEPAWVDDLKQPWNCHASQPSLIKMVLTAALDPNFVVMAEGCTPGSRPSWQDSSGEELWVHPSSMVHPLTTAQLRDPFLVYLEKVKTSRVFLRDCTVVPPMALLLAGGELQVLHDQGVIMVDRYVRIRAPPSTAVLVKKLRAAVDGLLEDMVRAPGGAGPRANPVISAIAQVLREQEQRAGQLQ